MRVVIIGSRVAGVSVATELRKKDKDIEIIMIEKSDNLPYSPCSLPYVIAGEIENFEKIISFKQDFFDIHNIIVLNNSLVTDINRKKKIIYYSHNNKEQTLPYDYLVVSTGSKPFVPKIKGVNDVQYLTLSSMEDAKKILSKSKKRENAVIIGGGFVGLEIAYALNRKGMKATIVEARDGCLCELFDNKMTGLIEEHFEMLGVSILINKKVKQIDSDKVILKDKELPYSLLVLATGVRSNDELAKKIGLDCDEGILVNKNMMTSDKRIFACGDCVNIDNHSNNLIATNAVRQASIVANNILGEKQKLGSLSSTIITKTGDIVLASTGITFEKAEFKGMKPFNAFFRGKSKVEYMTSKKDLFVYLVADKKGKLIGAQIIGYEEVLGRINWLSLAIKQGLSVEEFSQSDYGYNPPIAPVFDPVITCSELLLRKIKKRK